MQFMCPCLNITINTDSCEQDVDSRLRSDLISNQKILTDLDDFKMYTYDRSDTSSVYYVHSELIGVIKKSNYSMIKCFMCNIFTHIVNSTFNMILINNRMTSDLIEVDNLKKSENYSQLFRVILNPKTLEKDCNKDLTSYTNNEKLTLFPALIKMKSDDYISKEHARIEKELETIRIQYQNNLAKMETRIKDEIKILNSLYTTVVNQFEENKINSQESAIKSISVDPNAKKTEKEIIIDSSEMFDFEILESDPPKEEEEEQGDDAGSKDKLEEAKGDDYVEGEDNFDDDEIIASTNKIGFNMIKADNKFENKEFNDDDDSDDSDEDIKEKHEGKASKYSCSMPQSIPNSFGGDSLMNRLSLNKANQNLDSSDSEERSASNMGEKITELASKIVTKDGSELFGERPNRRVPVMNVIKTHTNHLTK